jgi:hypothetical protein
MQLASVTGTASESIDPSARKKRGPQDDSGKNSPVLSVVKDLRILALSSRPASA